MIGNNILRVGYVPISSNFNSPGDKRRFVYYANRRNIKFEIAHPSKSYDLVVITQNSDISIWKDYDKGRAKIVYDFIDSYLAISRNNIKGRLRGLAKYISGQSRHLILDHWKAIGDMCSRADAVVCSTEEQRSDILEFCPNVHIVLDAHMSVASNIKSDYSAHSPFKLVWEGLPQNIASLNSIVPAINELGEKKSIELHIVTDAVYNRYLGKYWKTNTVDVAKKIYKHIVFREWDERNCAEIICSCDLGVIPLNPSDPFSAGKPENKLLLLWRMGMPVVTAASPAYIRAMNAAGMNYTARDDGDWIAVLSELIDNHDARRSAGNLGRNYVESKFSEKNLMAQWDKVFETCGLSFS